MLVNTGYDKKSNENTASALVRAREGRVVDEESVRSGGPSCSLWRQLVLGVQ